MRIIRIAGAAAGVLVAAWAFWTPFMRDQEGALTGLIALPLTLGASLVLISSSLGTRWLGSAAWLSLAAVGQAATFQITFAGPTLHYQHLKSVSEIISDVSVLIWGFLLLRAALVSVAVFARRRPILGWIKANFGVWQVIVIGLIFLLPSATVSEDVGFYVKEFLMASALQLVALGNLVLAGLSMPADFSRNFRGVLRAFFGKRSAEDGRPDPGAPDAFIASLAVLVFVLAGFLNFFSYERHPHIPDEVSYLMHARFFAAGQLTLPAPPVPEAFEVYLMQYRDGEWFPVAPPGWPMVLTLGTLLGLPWLVNPFLAGFNLLLAYVFLREIYSVPTARTAVVLLCFSPWYVFLGMSFMTHMSTLTFALIAAIGVAVSARRGSISWGWVSGFALGFISLIRPLEAVAMAGLLGPWAIGIGGRRLRPLAIVGLVAGSMLVGSIGLAYNAKLSGDPLVFPIMEYTDQYFGKNSNSYGFGPDRGMGWSMDPNPGHGVFDALVNSNLNVSTINTEMFGWSIGAFLLIAFLLFSGRITRGDLLMASVIAIIYVLHFFYYFSGGPDFAARYWFLMVVPIAALTARGISELSLKLNELDPAACHKLRTVVLALCVITFVGFIPWRAADKYHNFRGMRPDIRYLDQEYGFGRSLVLIKLGNDDYLHPDYDSAMVYNPLDYNADEPIYAWDRRSISCMDRPNCVEVKNLDTRRKLLEAYRDRPVWIVRSPTATGRGFEVEAGPLSADKLLEQED